MQPPPPHDAGCTFLGKIRRLFSGLALKVSCVKATTSTHSSDHADTQAMAISSAAGELTLGIGLGFVSVGLGILGLIIKSDCEGLSCCYGLIWCKKKRRRARRGTRCIDEIT